MIHVEIPYLRLITAKSGEWHYVLGHFICFLDMRPTIILVCVLFTTRVTRSTEIMNEHLNFDKLLLLFPIWNFIRLKL